MLLVASRSASALRAVCGAYLPSSSLLLPAPLPPLSLLPLVMFFSRYSAALYAASILLEPALASSPASVREVRSACTSSEQWDGLLAEADAWAKDASRPCRGLRLRCAGCR